MLFECNTEESIIRRLELQERLAPTIRLDFTSGKTYQDIVPADGLVKDIMELIDGGISEEEDPFGEFDPDAFEKCKRSEKSKEYYGGFGFFKDAYGAAGDDKLQRFYNDVVGDIENFIKALGIKLHWQQQQLIDAYKNGESMIAVRSGQGPGKTFCSCVIWLHWMISNPYSLLVITSPTMRQCKEVWMAQARQLIANAKDSRIKEMFEFTNTQIGILGNKPSDWGSYIATASKAENFQGIHREYLGIHCEEASGLERPIIDTIQGTLSGDSKNSMWLMIGNPNTRDCAFYDSFYHPSSSFFKIHWNGEETPISKHYGQERIDKVVREHGKDSNFYRIRVLGEFPEIDADSILNLEMLMSCSNKENRIRAIKINAQKRSEGTLRKTIGLDFASMGGDVNVIAAWLGNILKVLEGYTKIRPLEMIDKANIHQTLLDWSNDETLYIADTSGLGETAVEYLADSRRKGRMVHEFYSQNTAADPTKYANKITEAWFEFAKAVRAGDIYIPKELMTKKFCDQITSRKFELTKTGQLIVESKKVYKARISKGSDVGTAGSSPDEADATLMGFYPYANNNARVSVAG